MIHDYEAAQAAARRAMVDDYEIERRLDLAAESYWERRCKAVEADRADIILERELQTTGFRLAVGLAFSFGLVTGIVLVRLADWAM